MNNNLDLHKVYHIAGKLSGATRLSPHKELHPLVEELIAELDIALGYETRQEDDLVDEYDREVPTLNDYVPQN